jgi:hypothetical protein
MAGLAANSGAATEDDRVLVRDLLEKFDDWCGDSWADDPLDPASQKTVKLLMDATVKWKEEELWLQAVAKAKFYYPVIGRQRIKEALSVFPFESVKET